MKAVFQEQRVLFLFNLTKKSLRHASMHVYLDLQNFPIGPFAGPTHMVQNYIYW